MKGLLRYIVVAILQRMCGVGWSALVVLTDIMNLFTALHDCCVSFSTAGIGSVKKVVPFIVCESGYSVLLALMLCDL